MDISTLGTVVGIVAICYVIGLGCKAYEKIPDKWIPVIIDRKSTRLNSSHMPKYRMPSSA